MLGVLAPYMFRQRLIHMGYKYGCWVYEEDEYMTTQTCSNCGSPYKIGGSKIYKCPCCGMEADRDENSGKNILKVGLKPAKKKTKKLAPVKKQTKKLAPVKKQPKKLAPVKKQTKKLAPVKKQPKKLVPVKKQTKQLAPVKKQTKQLAPVKKQTKRQKKIIEV